LGAFGAPGHAFPMLALGERLVQRGHHVTFETWERWRPYVRAAGMEFVAAPEYQVFPPGGNPLKPYEAVVRATGPTRTAVIAQAPHVVVHDILTLAPAMAAELEGVPRATLIPHLYPVTESGFPPYSIGARLPRTPAGRWFWDQLEGPLERGLLQGRTELNESRRRVGLPAVQRLHGGLSPDLCLVASFPALEYPRVWPAHVHVIGPMLWEPPAAGEPPLPPGDKPLILVAPSTSHDPGQRLLQATINGLAGCDLRVLASLDGRPLRRPVRASRRTRLVNWLSYARAMPHAAAVVCHAGHGTVVRSLANGVPIVAVPHSGDMAENAARVDWARVGVRLPWRLLSPATIRLAVERTLLDSGDHSSRAAALATWAGSHDGPTRAAELVEVLASR
jgi:UDP:flavonoid glycosyltransferase YjiC (YdhE family)